MGEAKQLPRIAGPTVAVMGSSTKGSGFRHQSFVGNVVPSIIPLYTPKNFRRPGDVFVKPSSSRSSSRQAPRPLGLIPDRSGHDDDLPGRFTRTLFTQSSKGGSAGQVNTNSPSVLPVKPSTAPTNRLKPLNVQYRTKSALTIGDNVQSSIAKLSTVHENNDPDYMDILSRLNEHPHYMQSVPEHVSYLYVHEDRNSQMRCSVCLPVKLDKQRKQSIHNRRRAHSLKPNMEAYEPERYHTARPSASQYINFVEQASIYQKEFDADKRDGLDYIPCERCRLRGGRCSNCKTIRIGGGYLILDGDNDSSDAGRDRNHLITTLDPNNNGHLPMLTDSNQVEGHGSHNEDLTDGHGGRLHHDGDSDDERRRRSQFGQSDGKDGKGGRYNDSSGFSSGTKGHDNMHNSRSTMGYDGKMGGNGDSTNNNTNNSGLDNGLGNRSNRSGVGLSQSKSGTGGNSSDDLTGGLDRAKSSLSNTSRPGSSRPVSSRPASRLGSGRRGGYERRNRKGGSTSMEKQYGGRRKKRSGDDDSSGSSDSDDDEAKRRRRKKDSGLPEIDENASNKNKANKKKREAKDFDLTGHYSGEDSEPEQKLKYRGSLYKFKSKKDNVKAIKCTLKELQGIDPLDYLAKYCIIDQSKLPNYRRVYDNVDRDEDDDIDITELDFALKAVNYDLISDAEVDYVNQILELSSRYKLNFHLFSVIAALSEKVVSLEDMVKKLINQMDLKALETKMKKCKELFYLLDDMDSGERDGVVTVASLAVELQAGGLTEEHVEFVVDRLNHDKKGLVEFLDYLTYVPLFVEIHDSVCGNPLDFSRTK